MNPENVTPAPSGEGVAENYVATELKKARETLKYTTIGSAVTLIVLGLYLGYMTKQVTNYSQPDVAGDVASSLIADRVNDNAVMITDKIKEQIPVVMNELPKQALDNLPEARKAIVAQVTGDLNEYCDKSADQLGKDLDTFIDAHKDEIKTVFEAGQDKDAVKAMGPELKTALMGYVKAPTDTGGDSVETKLNQALTMLKTMRIKTDKLAKTPTAQLTTDDLKTRRAIAIISRTVNKQLKGLDAKKIIADHISTSMPAG